MRAIMTEFVGTWLFITSIGLAIANAGNFAPLVIGVALAVVVYMGGHVSGAHYNPAVSLGLWVNGTIHFGTFIAYVIAQIAGALAGAATSYLALSNSGAEKVSFAVAASPDASLLAIYLVEAVFTFMLMLVILNVAVSSKTKGNSYYGLAIGFTIVVAAYVAGGISGGAFNPAVATGSILWDVFMAEGAGGGNLSNILTYVIAPCIGALLATFFFMWQDSDDVEVVTKA